MQPNSADDKARPGSSWECPAAIGATVKTRIERGDRYSAPEIYNLEITALQILRGAAALLRLKSGQACDPELRDGYEYIVVQIRIGYYSRARGLGRSGKPYVIEPDCFHAASADGKTIYETPGLNDCFQERLAGRSLLPGQSVEGWVAFQVPQTEQQPLIAFSREYRENTYGVWPPIWFRV